MLAKKAFEADHHSLDDDHFLQLTPQILSKYGLHIFVSSSLYKSGNTASNLKLYIYTTTRNTCKSEGGKNEKDREEIRKNYHLWCWRNIPVIINSQRKLGWQKESTLMKETYNIYQVNEMK